MHHLVWIQVFEGKRSFITLSCLLPTCSEEGSRSIVHGQSMDELSGCSTEWPSLKEGEGQRSVVWSNVQLQRGMDANQQVDRLDGQLLQLHGVDQCLRWLENLDHTSQLSKEIILRHIPHIIMRLDAASCQWAKGSIVVIKIVRM